MPKESSESQTMGIRLNARDYAFLEDFSKKLNMKKSQIVKEALRAWMISQNTFENRDFALIPKSLLKSFFTDASTDSIRRYASEQGENFLANLKIIMLMRKKEATIENLVPDLNDIFSFELMNWFSSFDVNFDKNARQIQIYGLHSQNQNFSFFLKEFFSFILTRGFSFQLDSFDESITESAIHLTFTKTI